MQPAVTQAVDAWEQLWNKQQEAAVAAMKAAFPQLTDQPRYVGCNDIRLEYEETGLGGGRVCIDDEGRAEIEFYDLPNGVIAQAVDNIRLPYLDHADGPLVEAPPGTYVYDCEMTRAQFEFVLGMNGQGQVNIWFATIPDAAGFLATLTEAAQAGT